MQRFFYALEQRLGGALESLECNVSGEAIGDDYVKAAQRDVFALCIAGEVGNLLFHDGMALLGKLRAFRLLLADVEQPYRRVVYAERRLGIYAPHQGELHEILRFAVGIGPHVGEHGLARRRGDDAHDCGALDTLDAPDHERGCRHARASRPRGIEPRCLAFLHEATADDNRRILLLAHRIGRVLPHPDDFFGRHRLAALVPLGKGHDDFCRASQVDEDFRVFQKRLASIRRRSAPCLTSRPPSRLSWKKTGKQHSKRANAHLASADSSSKMLDGGI